MKLLVLIAVFSGCAAHGNLVWPPSWMDAGAKNGYAAGKQCRSGCTGKSAPGELERGQHCACEWYSNNTVLPKDIQPTIADNSTLRTYMDWNFHRVDPAAPDYPVDYLTRNPWRAPGRAPNFSPCGIDGGNPKGCLGNKDPSGCAGGGYGFGPDARTFDFPDVVTTDWAVGEKVEVAWGITANHGGGYAYRLCKRPLSLANLEEDCFQQTHLDFVGDTWWAQWGTDKSTRMAFNATRTSTGTWPSGSQWTKNPIPACVGPGSGTAAGRGEGHSREGAKPCSAAAYVGSEWEYAHPSGTQFPPPGGYPSSLPDHKYLYGFGDNNGGVYGSFQFSIVDLVQVPKNIAPGDYVLSFRYDCEQTSQVWNSCANIKISS